jgi:hypothetical protein
MPNDTLSAMRQSIIDGAPDSASSLAQEADGYAKDAMSAVTLAQELMQQKLQTVS